MSKWIKMWPAESLPLVNQHIFYVVDYRGSHHEYSRKVWNEVLDKMSDEQKGVTLDYWRHPDGTRTPRTIFPLYSKVDPRMLMVKEGWVEDRYPDSFTVRDTRHGRPYMMGVFSDIDVITHWMPIDRPELPFDPLTDIADELDRSIALSDRYDERRNLIKEGVKVTDSWSGNDSYEYSKAHSMELL